MVDFGLFPRRLALVARVAAASWVVAIVHLKMATMSVDDGDDVCRCDDSMGWHDIGIVYRRILTYN